MTDSLARLKQAVADSNITQVANKIGIPRCSLSLVVNDKYPANPKKILQKFEDAYGDVSCPYLNADITRDQCRAFSTKPRPSNPLGLSHWKACQNCALKGAKPCT